MICPTWGLGSNGTVNRFTELQAPGKGSSAQL
jgi:hypothetical protein